MWPPPSGPCPSSRGAGTARLALYRPSEGPLSLEPLAPSSCRPGQSAAEPPGARREKVLWPASSRPSCVGHLPLASPPRIVVAGEYFLLRDSGCTVISRRRFLTGFVLAWAPL